MKFNRKRTISIVAALLILFVVVPAVWAHPLGNFTISRYTSLELQLKAVELLYIVDMAEIPTFQERQQIDQNGDGEIDEAEQTAYADQQVGQLAQNLALVVNGQSIAVTPESWAIEFLPGQGDLPTLRLELLATAVLPETENVWQLEFSDNNYPERLGWQEAVVTAVAGINIANSSVFSSFSLSISISFAPSK